MPISNLRVSVKQLAEYMTGTPAAKSKIIEQLLEETFDPNKNWYGEFPSAFANYLSQQDFYPTLGALKTALLRRPTSNTKADEKAIKQLEAIDLVAEMSLISSLPLAQFFDMPRMQNKFVVGNCVLATGASNYAQTQFDGQTFIGAVAPYLKSTKPLTAETAKIHTTALHWLAEDKFNQFGVANYKCCAVVDIFGKKIFGGTKNYKQLREQIRVTLDEIFERVQYRNLLKLEGADLQTGQTQTRA